MPLINSSDDLTGWTVSYAERRLESPVQSCESVKEREKTTKHMSFTLVYIEERAAVVQWLERWS